MAMEDAYVLGRLMSPDQELSDIVKAFRIYDSIRRPRTQEVVRLSRLCGLTYTFLDEGVGKDMAKMERELTRRFSWVWDEDLERTVSRRTSLRSKL